MDSIGILPMPGGSASAQLLDPMHYEMFHTAISHILSMPITRFTIAQLIDGLPLYSVVLESAAANNLTGAPIQAHTQLCEGAIERADEFIKTFDPNSLLFRAQVGFISRAATWMKSSGIY